MDYEKKYKEALERAKIFKKHLLEINDEGYAEEIDYIFPELKESEDEKIRETLLEYLKKRKEEADSDETWHGLSYDSIIAWLEKQKEPKFHEGDWVVLNEKYPYSIYQVKKIENYHYFIRHILGGAFHIPFGCEYSMRLWTIKDAKDGDVLVLNGEVFIYAHRKQLYSIAVAHCFIDSVGVFHFDGEFGYTEKGNSIHPATKEQRDTLFAKMREAGYEWDEDKKLKKL